MSEKATTGSDKPPPTIPCPVCGAADCPAGFHDNKNDKVDGTTGTTP